MIDDSLKETEALGKRIGNELKASLKEQNSIYVPTIKQKIEEGIKEYYDKLTDSITNELLTQESEQKNLMDNIDQVNIETEKVKKQQQRIRVLIEKMKIVKHDKELKALAFRLLLSNIQDEKKNRKIETQLIYYRIYRLKKLIFSLFKKTTTFKPIKEFDLQVKTSIEKDLKTYEDTQIKEKENILQLIYQAEEKLKHENRKKIQTKLLLDQIVLRGVSAMNIHALTLSNNSLKGKFNLIVSFIFIILYFRFDVLDVYNTDYRKDIERTFHSFNLPKTKDTLSSFNPMKQ